MEDTDVEATFKRATDYLPHLLAKTEVDSDSLLYLYARFKQASEGKCCSGKPSFFEFQARKKWEAWNSLGEKSQADAKLEYIDKISELDPEWMESAGPRKKEGWISVSSMIEGREDAIDDRDKDVYDWCRDGDLIQLKRLVTRDNINLPDEIGLTLLHWACDRGHPEVVKYLLQSSADVTLTDSDGQSALHYACSCGRAEIAQLLLEHRADPKVKDKEGNTALDIAENDIVKKMVSSWVFWRGSGESFQS